MRRPDGCSRAHPAGLTDDDPFVTGKIALAHVNEFRDFYTQLERIEEQAKREKG